MLHEALDRTADDLDACPVQLAPNLVGAIDLPVGVPDLLDPGAQDRIVMGVCRKRAVVTLSGGRAPIPGGGNPQGLADRSDPVGIPVPVDETV